MAPFLDGFVRASYGEIFESMKKYLKEQNSYDDNETKGILDYTLFNKSNMHIFKIHLF